MSRTAVGPGPLAADLPLRGLRVVELSSFVATPLAGMTLAQLGADVIRVDPPGGAADRNRWPVTSAGASLYWAGLNKGKRSVVIDSRTPRGRELVAALVCAPGDAGGIVLTNISGRAAPSYDELVLRRPDLIHLQLVGTSTGGTAVDYTVNAASGFALVTGPPDAPEPVNHVLPAWDVTGGLYLALGLLAAERARRATGSPQRVQVALEDVALATTDSLGLLGEAQLNSTERPRTGNDVYGTFGRSFATRDGRHVMVVALTPRQWAALVDATGTTGRVRALEHALEADLSREDERYTHRAALGAVLGPWFAARTAADVEHALSGTSVLSSRFRTFREVVDDDALPANPIVGQVDQPGIGRCLATGSPLRFEDRLAAPRPAPALGADTDTVLVELLGLEADELAALHRDAVVGPSPAVPAPATR